MFQQKFNRTGLPFCYFRRAVSSSVNHAVRQQALQRFFQASAPSTPVISLLECFCLASGDYLISVEPIAPVKKVDAHPCVQNDDDIICRQWLRLRSAVRILQRKFDIQQPLPERARSYSQDFGKFALRVTCAFEHYQRLFQSTFSLPP